MRGGGGLRVDTVAGLCVVVGNGSAAAGGAEIRKQSYFIDRMDVDNKATWTGFNLLQTESILHAYMLVHVMKM